MTTVPTVGALVIRPRLCWEINGFLFIYMHTLFDTPTKWKL
jgi:hypothetical protein